MELCSGHSLVVWLNGLLYVLAWFKDFYDGLLIQYLRHIKVTPCLARGGYNLSIFGAKVTQDFPGGLVTLRSWYQILVPRSWY